MTLLTLIAIVGVLGVITFGVIPVLQEILNELFRLGSLMDFMLTGADRDG